MPAEIIREWVGYNGKTTEEKKPDGSVKKTRHHKIWAAALTDSGHIYVRYGPAKHPLKLTEQIIRPKRGLSEVEALREAERIFQEKVQEKLNQKGYDAISFEAPPHYVPSFSKWRMSDEPEEVVVPVYEVVPPADTESVKPLQEVLNHLDTFLLERPCRRCCVIHARYLVDVGDGEAYTPAAVLARLHRTEQGAAWLTVPCLRQENMLLHADTQELLARVIDCTAEGLPDCAYKGVGDDWVQ
ncbi:MAG TPA: hypothetical protein VFV38_45875 [Ktedonobacteraceae bacterium]|nr:hypothetical protein [Ktedonobacteraceae bacterium]